MKNTIFTTNKNRDIELTNMGFGGVPIGNLYRSLSDQEAQETLTATWESDIRYFDTAPQYGHGLSEQRMGEFFKQYPRDSYVISTKVGRILEPCNPGEQNTETFFDIPNYKVVYDYSYDGVMRSYEESLKRLQMDHVDILYVHDVDIFTHGSKEASDQRIEEFLNGGYQALCELRDAGDVKAIGAGVNDWEVCETLALRGDFDLFLLAGRYTLLEQEALNSFLPLCEQKNIGIILGGPFNSGILATGPVEGAKYNYADAPAEILDRVREIETLCKKYQVPLPSAAIQFPLLHPSVCSVIPGGRTPLEVQRNVESLQIDIPDELWSDLRDAGFIHPDAPVKRA